MDYNTKSLEPLIRQALALVYSNDKHLIDTQAHERSIVFRFGFYFQNLLLLNNEYKDLHLDILKQGKMEKRPIRMLFYTNETQVIITH